MTTTTAPQACCHRATVLLAAVTLAAACGGMPERSDPRPLVGCHYFVQDDVARDLQLPWGVRLLDRPLEGWPALQQRPGVMQATTLTGHDEVDFPFGYWVVSAEDSLEIGYPAGGGLLLELAMINGAFEGRARPVGDAVPAPGVVAGQRAHPVRLTWARCPDEP
jgi:hypothetical protein